MLTIQESFLPPNVIVGEHGHVTVTIVDNELECKYSCNNYRQRLDILVYMIITSNTTL